ncbi:conserved unknown protein [Ectocarpus siliculosus]|uniref:Uncharacterized protein n=1 Tax=Ectocarpus siliculosus TaxID=2880 RepID=D7FJA2_ECTSI|nr:conserved unknown protein [Ectocarpus siliculosus]|eukprot:CBJ29008.1 conserved unknown protein [Ectocarpus siliculosus]
MQAPVATTSSSKWPKLWEGQTLKGEATKAVDPSASWFVRHRRLVGFVVPGLIAHIIWWSYAATHPSTFDLFTDVTADTPNWYMCVTMAFGSMVAGATSEGGASVAFPIMTLAFGIAPIVARDFSFMIQSAGMTAAAATIVIMQVQVEMHSLLWATVGGVAGIILGLEEVAPRLEPAYSKMFFVSTWAAFACSLFWLNRLMGRRVFLSIPNWEEGVLWEVELPAVKLGVSVNWKACVLFLCGFVGGIFSAISGSGIDICTFSILTLLFRVTEKTATPTSVVLMAINTLVGFMYRQLAMGGVEPEAVRFFTVCVPVVVIGAPLGSLLGSHLHRLVLAAMIYITDGVQFIGALVIVRPWSYHRTTTPLKLSLSSAAILVVGSIVFYLLARTGGRLLDNFESREKAAIEQSGDEKVAGGRSAGGYSHQIHRTPGGSAAV